MSVQGLITATLLVAAAAGSTDAPVNLRSEGAFGFPQRDAIVLCSTPTLRVSAFNDAEYLFVQAVVFNDGDATPGETEDGRDIGDHSTLRIDVGADGLETKDVDRDYSLDPWPRMPGLHYSVSGGPGSNYGLVGDSKGRGAIRYVPMAPPGDAAAGAAPTLVRVDTFLVPLAELADRKVGQAIRIAYWGSSTSPPLVFNSVGFTREEPYYSHHLPAADWHTMTLVDRGAAPSIDEQLVPEGRGTIAIAQKPGRPTPAVGTRLPELPEVNAERWINWKGAAPPSLSSLEGNVVVVEFWATWCGPCVQSIPHLNALHDAHAGDGLVILSLTDQKSDFVEKFVESKQMRFTVGARSTSLGDYGVRGIPTAFVIGRDGVLAWAGHPQEEQFDAAVKAALARR